MESIPALFFVLSSLIIFSINQAAAQDIALATFQEIAQVISLQSVLKQPGRVRKTI